MFWRLWLYGGGWQEFLKKCGNRKIVFDNKSKDKVKKESQVESLLQIIDNMLLANGGSPYANELFKEAQVFAPSCQLTFKLGLHWVLRVNCSMSWVWKDLILSSFRVLKRVHRFPTLWWVWVIWFICRLSCWISLSKLIRTPCSSIWTISQFCKECLSEHTPIPNVFKEGIHLCYPSWSCSTFCMG